MAFKELPEHLYYYCSMNTFLSIIANKSFWLNDVRMSNDSQEMSWGFNGVVTPAAIVKDFASDKAKCLSELHEMFHKPHPSDRIYTTWDGHEDTSPYICWLLIFPYCKLCGNLRIF